MQPYQERLIVEERELSEKLNDLGAFIHGDLFPTIEQEGRALLQEQDDHMRAYLGVLRKRISQFLPS